MLALAIIVLLISINALYVAAEFSAVSVRTSRIQEQAEGGNALARRLLPVLVDGRALDRYVAACQIGITISSLVAGAYAQAALAPALMAWFVQFGDMQVAAAQTVAALTVLIVLTVFQMVLGELVPKSLALQTPTRVALWTVIPMQWSLRLMAWFIKLLNGSGGVILRMLGVAESGHRHVHSADELSYLVAESGRGGLLKPSEQLRIRHALLLGERPARDLMVPRTAIAAIEIDMPFADAVELTMSEPYTRFPVYEETIDRIIGILHVRDLAASSISVGNGDAGARDVASATVSPLTIRELLRPVLVVPVTVRVDRLLTMLRQERRTMAILVDEFGGTAGLITVDNILDDLIGDIGDEFRPTTITPLRLPDGRVRLPGRFPADEAGEWTGVHWDTLGASTVGGVIMNQLERMPTAGEHLHLQGMEVEIERVDKRVISSIVVTPARRPPDDDEREWQDSDETSGL